MSIAQLHSVKCDGCNKNAEVYSRSVVSARILSEKMGWRFIRFKVNGEWTSQDLCPMCFHMRDVKAGE